MIAVVWAWVALAGPPSELYQQSYEQEALGAYRSALDTLGALPQQERRSYVYALRRAWLLYLDGQLERSVETYDDAIQRAPRAIEPLLGKMLPLMAARRWSDAEAVGREVLARDQRNYLGRSRLAWTRYNLGRYGEAEQLYREILEDYPGDVEMRAGLGWALLKLGRRADARTTFDEVLRVAPKHASARAGRDAI